VYGLVVIIQKYDSDMGDMDRALQLHYPFGPDICKKFIGIPYTNIRKISPFKSQRTFYGNWIARTIGNPWIIDPGISELLPI
jgi:hypothetical protein